MEDEIYQQMSLWDLIYPKKIIDKPIRLIEFFAGIGAQHKALKQLTDQVESWKICEWAYNSYCSYNAIHIKDFTDYSQNLSKEELIEKVRGTSTNLYMRILPLQRICRTYHASVDIRRVL